MMYLLMIRMAPFGNNQESMVTGLGNMPYTETGQTLTDTPGINHNHNHDTTPRTIGTKESSDGCDMIPARWKAPKATDKQPNTPHSQVASSICIVRIHKGKRNPYTCSAENLTHPPRL